MKEPPSYILLLTILSDQGLMYISSFLGIAFLLLLSATISASEGSYFSISLLDLDQFRTSTDKRHKLISSLLGRPRLLLVSMIVLNTLVDVAIITLSVLLLWGASGSIQYMELALFLTLFFCILAIAVFGKILPKVYGKHHNISVAQRTVYAWKVWVAILKPFSAFLIKMASLLEKRFKQTANQQTAGELNQALELATENTRASDGDVGFLRSIVNFGAQTVAQVMRPRHEISAINIEANFHQLMESIQSTTFARIPIFRKTIDNIVGVLYTKDLLPFIQEEKNYHWQTLIRPGFFVPETKQISSLLKDFQEKHVHMAIAINDSRHTVGLVTLEDLVHEIIGNIQEGKSDK